MRIRSMFVGLLLVGCQTAPDTQQGGSRLKVVVKHYVGDDGSSYDVSSGGYHDTQLNVDCYVSTAEDHILRCLPNTDAYVPDNYFTDAACTQKASVASAYSSGTGCSQAPTYAVQGVQAGCDYLEHVFQIGAQYSGNLYQSNSSNCSPVAPSPQVQLYSVGSEIAASTFVAFKQQQ